jgi:hypothetical protein
MWLTSVVVLAGTSVCTARIAYEKLVWNTPDAALLFSALHSRLALIYWLSVICALLAHVWVFVLVLWSIARREDRTRALSTAALLTVEIGLLHAPSAVWLVLK